MSILEAFLEGNEELGEETKWVPSPAGNKIVSLEPSPPSPPSPKHQSQPEPAIQVQARVRGRDEVVQAVNPDVCFHCHGAKACLCALCAVPARPMGWQAGECKACLGTGYLTDTKPGETAATPQGCPGPELCGGHYVVGRREDGTPIYIHPPKGKPHAQFRARGWKEWPLPTGKVQ